jgi:UDP-glucose:(glucosyl)LPS alpha-1,2-glucosyltransferase
MIDYSEISAKSKGGTELMCRKLESLIDPALMAEFQIIPSRVRELDETKIRILWLHDLPDDPESKHLANDGWKKFHRLVFVSHWQMQAYINKYKIPWSHCQVLLNAIVPVPRIEHSPTTIRLIYHTTPHRGLNILWPVFEKLCETHSDIHLDVYSSFNLYGWANRDKEYEPLFDLIREHKQASYHGVVSNEDVRAAVGMSDIFAYPSTWHETSCLSLMEAMSAGLLCVHPTLGALAETAANWTMLYQWDEVPNRHAGIFYQSLNAAIDLTRMRHEKTAQQLASQAGYTNVFYGWDLRKLQWGAFLTSLVDEPRAIEKEEPMFRYSQ